MVTSRCFPRERRHDERSSEHTNCKAGQYGYILKRRHSFESSARLNKKDSKMSDDKEDLFWNHQRETREENGSRKREGKTYKVTRLGENGCGYCLKVVENPDLTENFSLPSLTPVVE